jgi:23S rRNA (guanosine2251-2'-O)-methyltransferase
VSARAGRLVVGLHPVRELLRAGRPITRVVVASTRRASPVLDEIRELAADRGVPLVEVARDELDARADGLVHQGVLAEAPPLELVELDVALALLPDDERALFVAVDGITDPHNLGSIARTAEAVGAHGLLVADRRAVGVTPTVEKAAAGALAHLPLIRAGNLARALEILRAHGVWSLGLDGAAPDELGTHPLAAEPCVVVVGAEGTGLRRLTRERCDALVRLPMRGHVGSLNAAVAAGVALYTILARRG